MKLLIGAFFEWIFKSRKARVLDYTLVKRTSTNKKINTGVKFTLPQINLNFKRTQNASTEYGAFYIIS